MYCRIFQNFSCCFIILVFLSLGLASPSVYASDQREDLMEKARQLSIDGKYEAAKLIYKQLLENNPKDIEAAFGLATVTTWSGDYHEAHQLYEEVLKQQPAYRDALVGLGRLLFWQ